MKKFATLILTLGFLFQGSAFAIGAIAVDDSVGENDPGYGFVTGEDSEAAAKAGAMKQCKSSGNDNCKVVVWFKTCGAYASSKKYYGYGFGAIPKSNARLKSPLAKPAVHNACWAFFTSFTNAGSASPSVEVLPTIRPSASSKMITLL